MNNSGLYMNNWLFYLIVVGISIVIIWCISRYVKKSHFLDEDSFYFISIDELGRESSIHDSGIRPSKSSPGKSICLQVLKREYNNGVLKDILKPTLIKIGTNPKNLKWKIEPENVTEEELYYLVYVIVPENSIYGTNQKFSIDLRKECT